MKTWEIFKKTAPLYLCLSKHSSFITNKNIYISKSGVNHFSCNFAIVENNNAVEQQQIIKKYFDCNGLIFCNESSKKFIDTWANSSNLEYLGKFPLMSINSNATNLKSGKNYNKDVIIKRVFDFKTLKDFFVVFTKIRNLKQEESARMFSKKIFNPNYFLYVAYYNNIPVGISMFINTEEGLMAIEVDVLEKFRKSNILRMFLEEVLSDAVENKIQNYFGLVTSPFVYKVGLDLGCKIEEGCHIWKKTIKEVL